MEVELIGCPANIIDIIYTACRTCYSSDMPINIFNNKKAQEDKLKLIKKVISSGHLSTVEHINFTFTISGISRACSHQLVRHRLCSFSQQSQRYVEIKEDYKELKKLTINCISPSEEIAIKSCIELESIVNKYFINVTPENSYEYAQFLLKYLEKINQGYKPEDARAFLPNCTKTNLVMTCNLRELIHICNLRLCKHAQLEIRTMVEKMRDCVLKENSWLKPYLVPNCKNCTDFRDCKEIK